MPYFAYGWPKLFSSDYGGAADDSFLHLATDKEFLFVVSSTAVQVWTAGLHRVRLSEIVRTEDELRDEGPSVDAFWSSAKNTLAVLTVGNYLLLYSVHTSKEPLLPGSTTAAGCIQRAELYLRGLTELDLGARATCLTGDSRHLLVGTDDGSVGNVSWQGKLREVTYPVPLDPEAAVLADAEASSIANPAASPSIPIVQLDYCESTRMLVVVMADGSCALCGAAYGAVSALHEVAFARWVCLPDRHAKCARIGAQAQMIAVGCANGEVVLYRLHRTAGSVLSTPEVAPLNGDTPLRVLTLEAWGHTVAETGGVTQVAWSPDCRALAVSFIQAGLVVWSPSGCRLMCSLRQVPGSLARRSSNHTGSTGRHACEDLGTTLEAGLSAMSWGPHGYQLLMAEVSNTRQIVELQFAQTLSSHHRVAHAGTTAVAPSQPIGEEVHVLQAHDRLLVISEGLAVACDGDNSAAASAGQGSDLVASHVLLPYHVRQYISTNWPLIHAAVTDTGMDIAVAGTRGLALYSRASEKWKLFGDVSQERQIRCRALCWLEGMILVCSGGPEAGASSRALDTAAAGAHELLLFPRYHLDFSSLLCRHILDQPPLCVHSVGSYVLVASEPLEITLLEVIVQGQLTPSGNPKARLQPIREISMLDVGRPLLNLALVPPLPPSSEPAASAASVAPPHSSSTEGMAAPRQAVLLRWGGLLSVLDLEKGSEVALSTEVESFWLGDSLSTQSLQTPAPDLLGRVKGSSTAWGPVARPGDGAQVQRSSGVGLRITQGAARSGSDLSGSRRTSVDVLRQGVTDNSAETSTTGSTSQTDIEMPWWAYGPAGMQLIFPSSVGTPLSPHTSGLRPPASEQQDVELEFDQEVYPVGISLADASIVGVTQRIVRGLGMSSMLPGLSYHQSGTGQFPGFYPIPESQPVLPCLLRRLLQKGAFHDALCLARRHERGPHFTRSLEWLLFTTLEMETSKSASTRGQHKSPNEAYHLGRTPMGDSLLHKAQVHSRAEAPPLLTAAADLARHFPQFADVVVSVARKTDAQLWPPLFAAVGPPSALLEGLLEAGALTSAACFLLVIDRLEGASVAHSQALRLIRFSLQRSQYSLCGELLRFIIPPGESEAPYTGSGAFGGALSSAAMAHSGNGLEGTNQVAVSAAKQQQQQQQQQKQQQQQPPPPEEAQQVQQSKPQQSWFGWLIGYSSAQAAAPLAGSAIATIRSTACPPPHRDHDRGEPSGPTRNPLHSPGGLTSPRAGMHKHSVLASGDGMTPALDAGYLVAQHAWQLLEHGRLAALASLARTVGALVDGLPALMALNRTTPYALQDHSAPDATQLLAALTAAVQELPVWNSGDVEHEATDVLSLCRSLGHVAYSTALSVLLVDTDSVSTFRQQHLAVWRQFVSLLKADQNFEYLYEIVDALSGDVGSLLDSVGGGGGFLSGGGGIGTALASGADPAGQLAQILDEATARATPAAS